MIKRILALVIVVTLVCPVFVEAATRVHVNGDGSVVGFSHKKLVLKERTTKDDRVFYYDALYGTTQDATEVFDCRFKSTKPSVAKVDSETGEVEGKKAGTATIKVTIHDTDVWGGNDVIATISHKVVVKRNTQLGTKKIVLYRKDRMKIPVKGKRKRVKKWRSKNPRIASVTKNGKVIAKRKGKTTITCVIGGKKRKVKVKVINPILLGGFYLTAGHSSWLSVAGHSSYGTHFKSSNPRIAKVSEYGKVKALRKGTVKIRCKSDGVWISTKIYVEPNKCTFSKVFKSMSKLYYGTVECNVLALYFRGNKLMVKTEILNKNPSTLKKMSYFKLKIYKYKSNGKKKRLFLRVLHNRIVNVKPFRKKKVSWCLSTKKKWKRKLDFANDRIHIRWEDYE